MCLQQFPTSEVVQPLLQKKQERVVRITTQDNQNGEMNLFNVQQAAAGPLNPVYPPNQPIGSTVAQIYADPYYPHANLSFYPPQTQGSNMPQTAV